MGENKQRHECNFVPMTKRILIIDDDSDMLEMLKIVFQSSDLDVVISQTGMTGQ